MSNLYKHVYLNNNTSLRMSKEVYVDFVFSYKIVLSKKRTESIVKAVKNVAIVRLNQLTA